MTSISTYTRKKRSSTSTPLEGPVLPLSSIMISASLIYVPLPESLCSSAKKNLLSSKTKTALSITNFFVCVSS